MDRLTDLLGPEMNMANSIFLKPYSKSEITSLMADMITGQHGPIEAWSVDKNKHGDTYYFPTTDGLMFKSSGISKKDSIESRIMRARPTEVYGIFGEYEGRMNYVKEFAIEINDVLIGGSIKEVSDVHQWKKHIAWTFETFDQPPIGLFNRLLKHLPGETMGVAWVNYDNNHGGYLAYQGGRKIADSHHGSFSCQALDVAIYRGLTEEDMHKHFVGYEYWSQADMPDCIEGEGEDSTVSKYILDHILEHQACIDNFSDETKLDLALCYFVLRNAYDLEEEDGAMLNDRDALINRLLDDYALENQNFSKGALMLFLNEFASEMTIVDILEKISSPNNPLQETVDLDDISDFSV